MFRISDNWVCFLNINYLRLCYLTLVLKRMMRWYGYGVPFDFLRSVILSSGVWRSSQVVFCANFWVALVPFYCAGFMSLSSTSMVESIPLVKKKSDPTICMSSAISHF